VNPIERLISLVDALLRKYVKEPYEYNGLMD
jgi:hypothetical protein